MAENPGEDIPIDPQPENIPEEVNPPGNEATNPADETVILTPNQATENMEVHHHSHHTGGKKHFKVYLLEFFMIFLAVVAGFIAENIREHYIEGKRGDQYILSVAEDLKQDIFVLDSIITIRKNKDKMLDSLIWCLNADPVKYGNDIYFYARWAPRTYRFYSHDRTISQLKSSGWRLIHNSEVSQQLQLYDELVRSLNVYIEQREESLVLIMYSSLNKLFDNRVFSEMVDGMKFRRPVDNPQLLSSDKASINEFCNQVHFLKNSNMYFISTSGILLANAKKALSTIEKHSSE